MFQGLLQGPGQVRPTLCRALGWEGDRQGLGKGLELVGTELCVCVCVGGGVPGFWG